MVGGAENEAVLHGQGSELNIRDVVGAETWSAHQLPCDGVVGVPRLDDSGRVLASERIRSGPRRRNVHGLITKNAAVGDETNEGIQSTPCQPDERIFISEAIAKPRPSVGMLLRCGHCRIYEDVRVDEDAQ